MRGKKMKSIFKSKTAITGATAVIGAIITGLESGADAKTIIIGVLGVAMIILRRMTTEPVK